MSTYPVTIRRCQHIKVNGIQCGSPALRNEKQCFYHEQCRAMCREINMKFSEADIIKLPTLEDANSIQLGLHEVMRLLVTRQIDHKIASLLLGALRAAAANVKFTSLEPKPTHIVIDRNSVENRPLGATAWSKVEGQEYDLIEKNDLEKNGPENNPQQDQHQQDEARKHAHLMRLVAGVARDRDFLDRPVRQSATNENQTATDAPVRPPSPEQPTKEGK
jgi:hypothetical protein